MRYSKYIRYVTIALVVSALSALTIPNPTFAEKAGKDSSDKTEISRDTKTQQQTSSEDEFNKLLLQYGTTIEQIHNQIQNPYLTPQASAAGEKINWQTIGHSQKVGVSTNYRLTSVVEQTAVGLGNSSGFGLSHGYVQPFGSSGSACCNLAGDADNSEAVNIGDVTFIISRLFTGGAPPICCEEGDANGSGSITIGDVTYLIARLFKNAAPPICGPAGMSCSIS